MGSNPAFPIQLSWTDTVHGGCRELDYGPARNQSIFLIYSLVTVVWPFNLLGNNLFGKTEKGKVLDSVVFLWHCKDLPGYVSLSSHANHVSAGSQLDCSWLLLLLLSLLCISLAPHRSRVDLSLTTSPSDPGPSDVLLFSGDYHCHYSKGQLH